MPDNNLNSMLEIARQTMQNSYSPYSHYSVGACIITENELIFSGTNVENASYGLSVCAETAAISAMVSAGYNKIKDIVITGQLNHHDVNLCAPCGACRQRIMEFSSPTTRIHLADSTGIRKTFTVAELLPESFGPKHLNTINT
jgi:cytidine deaminase